MSADVMQMPGHRWLRVVPHAEFYFGSEDCNAPLMMEEPDAPAIAELYRQATQKAERLT
jgi:hypothetical protein